MKTRESVIALENYDNTITHDDSAFDFIYLDEGGQEQTGLVKVDDIEQIEDAEEASKEVDQLISTTTALESIRVHLKNTPEHTPFSRSASLALESALQNMMAREKPYFAIEHLEGKQSRKIGMKAALEDLGETIRITIKKIVIWIKRAAEIVFDHIEGIVRGANATAEAAGKLQDLAARVRGELGDVPPQDTTVSNKKLAGFFCDAEAHAMTSHDIAEHYTKFTKDFNDAFERDVATAGSHYVANQINEILKQNTTDKFTQEAAIELSDKTIGHMIATNFKAFTPNNEDKNLEYRLPFGGEMFVINVREEEGKRAGISFGVKVSEKISQEYLPVLKASEVYDLAKMVESSMHRGIYRDYKKVKSSLYSLKKSIVEMCDEISRQQRDSFGGTLPSLHFLKNISETMLNLVNDTYRYNGKMARSILAYGHASLKQFGSLQS